MYIEGQQWHFREDETGTWLSLEKDGCGFCCSIGHPDDTMEEFLRDLVTFLEQTQAVKRQANG